MDQRRQKLSVYRIKDKSHGYKISRFNDPIRDDAVVTEYALKRKFTFTAKLFVSSPSVTTPKWVGFVKEGFADFPDLPDTNSLSAVLIVRPDASVDIFYAFVFGFGRHLLKNEAILEKFGLKVALNSLFSDPDQGSPFQFNRIRKVVAKTVAENTMHTSRQANRGSAFELFGIDVDRDILRSITGRPEDTKGWGTIISGSDAASISPITQFSEIGKLCVALEKMAGMKDYRNQFSWIDNVGIVTDPVIRERLEAAVIDILKQGGGEFQLAPPEIIDWDDVTEFSFSIDEGVSIDDLFLSDYLRLLNEGDLLPSLTIDQIRKEHKCWGKNKQGEQEYSWSIFECLNGEIEFEGKTILIDGGEFYEVDHDYVAQLNKYLSKMKELDPTVRLPNSYKVKDGRKDKDISEENYNDYAVKSNKEFTLLDRKPVSITNRTTPVEICDILSSSGHFIHIKRKLSSSSLSHLFSQGFVSAELLLSSQEFREKVIEKIEGVKYSAGENKESLASHINLKPEDRPDPGKVEIVYAIIADWELKGKDEFVRRLPFFSKVNLRHHVQGLRAMGFNVRYKRIGIDQKNK